MSLKSSLLHCKIRHRKIIYMCIFHAWFVIKYDQFMSHEFLKTINKSNYIIITTYTEILNL